LAARCQDPTTPAHSTGSLPSPAATLRRRTEQAGPNIERAADYLPVAIKHIVESEYLHVAGRSIVALIKPTAV
jgi:hypothetical protein